MTCAPLIRGDVRGVVGGVVMMLVAASAAMAQPSSGLPRHQLFAATAPLNGRPAFELDGPGMAAAARQAGPFVVERFPLGYDRVADLRLERFRVTAPGARFVIGTDKGDRPVEFDPEQVVLLRGRALGHAGSHAFLAVSPWGTQGLVDLGGCTGKFAIASRAAGGPELPAHVVNIFPVGGSAGPGPTDACVLLEDAAWSPLVLGPTDDPPVKGLRQIELAVETDHKFFQLFGGAPEATAYLVSLYGAVSDIFMTNINARVDLTYTRVWPQANEPFAASLNAFQNYWNDNMASVHRDVAQMYSGDPTKPGGVAYLSQLCTDGAYSFCGNATGYFFSHDPPNVYNYDLSVTAHELGHNFGTHHTDVYGIDNCNTVAATPQRGTIMSYCNQTVSGGMSVIDLSFHKITQQRMRDYIVTVTNANCIVYDCNQNGVSDAIDIATGFSPDTNGNGIPDTCEDCNANGVLDPADIAAGTSEDENANGIPDECEPDCNNNGHPDDQDIELGVSQDLHGDNVPDECDPDCNTNNQSDYNEIMANMTLDKDRNIVPDGCQDCDNDGTPDLTELEGADNAWVASSTSGVIREYHAVVGVHIKPSTGATLSSAQDLIITPDRRVLVTSAGDSRVVEFDRFGAFVRNLVPTGGGSLSNPSSLMIAPWGNLLVASRGNNSVREYDLGTGVFVRVYASGGGLTAPYGIAFGPDGHFYVTSGAAAGSVLRFNGTTGAFMNVLVSSGSGGLDGPRGILFKPDGNLLVCSSSTDRVLEFNGTTGAAIGPWNFAGPNFLYSPWDIRIGRSGNVYVSQNSLTETHVTKPRINEFHIDDGRWLRAYVLAEDSLILNPTGFDFMPGDVTDCNANQVPDGCDITSGLSRDHNANGRPDECECYGDCNGDGSLTVADFGCFQTEFVTADPYADCNADGQFTVADFGCFQTRFVTGCP